MMELLRWCWVNRAVPEYEELFTYDFRFAFAAADSADNAPILRDDEIEIARHLFLEGTATAPRANRIDYDYRDPIVPLPDSRPGKTSPWHQQVQTRVVLNITFDDGTSIVVDSDVNFFLVRGDSAQIPPDLAARGFGPDPNRWYIERWEERGGNAVSTGPPAETLASVLFRPDRSRGVRVASTAMDYVSWGELMARYHFFY
jgi:hypothetical protein